MLERSCEAEDASALAFLVTRLQVGGKLKRRDRTCAWP